MMLPAVVTGGWSSSFLAVAPLQELTQWFTGGLIDVDGYTMRRHLVSAGAGLGAAD